MLPAPGAALAEFRPLIAVFQIHHPDFNDIIGFGAAMLEVDLHPERVLAGRVELQFVVVAEPVGFRPACDSPNRWQALQFRFPIFDFVASPKTKPTRPGNPSEPMAVFRMNSRRLSSILSMRDNSIA